MQKILITGGAGFIGSNLVETLLKDGHHITSLDNYSTGKKNNHIKGVEYIEGHTKDIESLISMTPDLIYHLGEYARTSASFDNISQVWESNIEGTLQVLEFWRKNKCRLIYAGSSTKFGDKGEGRYQSPYAWSKFTNTELVKQYGEWFNLNYAISYFYNVYGPRELIGKHGTLIAIFAEQFKKGKPLTVVSPGDQRRNFTHVEDVVRGLKIMKEKASGDGYALGSEESFTLLEVAKMFGNEIKMLPKRKGDRQMSEIDLSKSKKELGWKAKLGLKDYIDSIKNE